MSGEKQGIAYYGDGEDSDCERVIVVRNDTIGLPM